jgi:hypothetical protein
MKVGDRDIVWNGTVVTSFGDSVVELTYLNLTYRLIFATMLRVLKARISRPKSQTGDLISSFTISTIH